MIVCQELRGSHCALSANLCPYTDGLSLGEEEREGYFRVAQYGQVYTLQARLNEMMLKVQL